MSRRSRMRVMVVVPSFAEGQERHPVTVARVLARRESLFAPEVRRRIDQPSRMQSDSDAQENSPHQHPPPAEIEEREADNNQWHIEETVEPDVKAILHQIRRVA